MMTVGYEVGLRMLARLVTFLVVRAATPALTVIVYRPNGQHVPAKLCVAKGVDEWLFIAHATPFVEA